jgi:uncharacterized membrane protein
MILIIHTAFSILALLAGIIFLLPKGTRKHKKIGYVYTTSMVICVVTSFGLFNLWGSFGVYHVLSIVSFLTLMIALYFPLFGRKNNNWIVLHSIWMGYSYVGLIMAAGSHLFGVFPNWPNWLRIGLFWVIPYVIGSILIFRNKDGAAKKAASNIKIQNRK